MLRSVDTRYDPLVAETPNPGPALLKRRLGEELRRLRLAADVTVAQTAAELGSSEAKVRHLENGRNVPSKPDLTVMIGMYGAPPNVHEELEELRQAANHRGWWSPYRLPTWLQGFIGLETDASVIRNFDLELIPGLLQTEAYARMINSVGPRVLDPDEVDRHVAARLKRQELLHEPRAVTYKSIISEAAFYRLHGTRTDIAGEQYRHLIAMAERPNVTVQVLPFSAGFHESMAGSHVLLSFPHGLSTPAAFLEYAGGGQLEHDRRIVSRLSEVHDSLSKRALSTTDSVDFITRLI
ncbi:MAG: helix-turn-helix domain-containing protein [Actinophytocola sp.]|uniref:helix-turn-helix domain-containing protein n=1 Tax=Actinophytocola sp. TaxID=1872138 RepID=UPI003D6C04D8